MSRSTPRHRDERAVRRWVVALMILLIVAVIGGIWVAQWWNQ